MGGGGSKKQKKSEKGGIVIPKVPPEPPYLGPQVECHFVNIIAAMEMNVRHRFLSADMSLNATRVDTYFPQLQQMYAQGYRMLTFSGMAGSMSSHGIGSVQMQQSIEFQGIFRKVRDEELSQKWELRIEKSVVQSQMFLNWNGNFFIGGAREASNVSNTNHIFQTIESVTQNGGRLICIELTGMAGMQSAQMQAMQNQQMNYAMMTGGVTPAFNISCDIFFDIPQHPGERQVYQVANVPLDSVFTASMPHGHWTTHCDWQGILTQYLGTGWRLVDVFMDMSSQQSMQGMGFGATMAIKKNTMWFFEKPSSKLEDPTPVYEGSMIEFPVTHHVSVGFGSANVQVQKDWEPTIIEMGKKGWEVVRILQTGDQQVSGMFSPKITMKCWIFFQRKIFRDNFPSQISTTAKGLAPPPAYGTLY